MWSTFVGGSVAEYPYGIVVDKAGDIYVVGSTASTNYPTTAGAFKTSKAGGTDAVVTKLRSDGSTIVWSTYLGGGGTDEARCVAVDGSGYVYVTGHTSSTDFPTTAGAFRTTNSGSYDAFIVKFAPDGGSLVYSTYYGGSWDDYPRGIAVDLSGNAYIGGFTSSSDIPTTPGVVKPTRSPVFPDGADGFIVKLNSSGTGLGYATYLGTDSGTDEIFSLALQSSGRVTVTGWTVSPAFPTTATAYDRSWAADREGFVTRLNETASGYVYSTFLGDTGRDEPFGIGLDGSGAAYIAGRTGSTAYPTTSSAYQRSFGGGTYDAFLSKLSVNGDSLTYSTFLGGSGSDIAYGCAVTSAGDLCIVGSTDGTFPTTSGAYDVTANGGLDVFVSRINCVGSPSLVYSTYTGSAGSDVAYAMALSPTGRAMVVGYTDNSAFPTTTGAYDQSENGMQDAFGTSYDVGIGIPTSVGDDTLPGSGPPPNPMAARLSRSPFVDRVSVHLSLESPAYVGIRIYDIRGRLLATLSDGVAGAGSFSATWDGRDARGNAVRPGAYLVEVTRGSDRQVLPAIKL